MTAILKITDGTNEIDLLQLPGLQLEDWRPAIADYKGGGTWRQSALSDGRRLVDRQFTNTIDTFRFKVRHESQDHAIRVMQDVLRLCEQAADYWAANWPTEYIYLVKKATNETNTQYAIIQRGRVPELEAPYRQPFLQPHCEAAMDGMTLIIEHGHWLSTTLDSPECLEIGAMQAACAQYPLVFDGADSYIDLDDPAALQNLPSADFTIDAWVYVSGYGEGNAGRIFDKSSWYFTISSTVGLRAFADFVGADAEGQATLASLTLDEWHHVAAVWDQANGLFTLWIDGEDVTNFQQAAVGAYNADAGSTGYIGSNGGPGTRTFDGEIGWLRISDTQRWTATFTPPARCVMPSDDGHLVGLWIYEGTPAAPGAGDIHDLSTNGNDGDGSDVSWGDCCSVYYGNYLPCSPRYMVFNATTSLVNCHSDASIDNLPAADFTVEAWIYATGHGEGGNGYIVSKNGITWVMGKVNFGGFDFYADFAVGDVYSWSDGTLLTLNAWHHVAATFDFSTRRAWLWVDGQNATTGGQTAGNGAYAGDAAGDLIIGNRNNGANTFDGYIQWVRISSGQRYTAGFTPPPRCTMPQDDTTTISLWSVGDPEIIVYDLYGPNAGTPTDLASDCDCFDSGREETCTEGIVYTGNKHNWAQLTHIFVEDGGVFGLNLLGSALPYPLLPAVPAANDRVYFGIDTSLIDSGPFCSLVFDLLEEQQDIADVVWEYSQGGGAWAAFNVASDVQDNTDQDGEMTGAAFDTPGVRSVHWEHQADWATDTVNGITGYWVRAEVQDVGTQPPVQQNRQIYTPLWPYIEVQTDEVGGDIPALVQQQIRNQSDDVLGGAGGAEPILFSNRTIIGLRSLQRGSNFTPFINFDADNANGQNAPGITVLSGGVGSTLTADIHTATGYKYRAANIGADVFIANVDFGPTIAQQYIGKFHAYVRGYQYSGVSGDLTIHLRGYQDLAAIGTGEGIVLTESVPFVDLVDWEVVDLGQLTIPFEADLLDSELRAFVLELYGDGDGAVDADFYELILMPVDEWALDTTMVAIADAVSTGTALGHRGGTQDYNSKLDVDSIRKARSQIRSTLKYAKGDYVGFSQGGYRNVASGPIIAQANMSQRYWFLHMDVSSDPAIGSRYAVANSLQMWKLQRYLGGRGDR